MHCPFCSTVDTKVIDSRLVAEGDSVRRRRECVDCGERFTTFEAAELVMPRLVKRDGTREPFDEEKLRRSFTKALEKRPVSVEAIDNCLNHIKHRLRAMGEREVSSQLLGEAVMEELRSVDEVAYVRFASVYRDFQDISEFQAEIQRMADAEGDEQGPSFVQESFAEIAPPNLPDAKPPSVEVVVTDISDKRQTKRQSKRRTPPGSTIKSKGPERD